MLESHLQEKERVEGERERREGKRRRQKLGREGGDPTTELERYTENISGPPILSGHFSFLQCCGSSPGSFVSSLPLNSPQSSVILILDTLL